MLDVPLLPILPPAVTAMPPVTTMYEPSKLDFVFLLRASALPSRLDYCSQLGIG